MVVLAPFVPEEILNASQYGAPRYSEEVRL
jgi:hypothetical protein